MVSIEDKGQWKRIYSLLVRGRPCIAVDSAPASHEEDVGSNPPMDDILVDEANIIAALRYQKFLLPIRKDC